jgi:thermitase
MVHIVRIILLLFLFMAAGAIPAASASPEDSRGYAPSELIVCFNPGLFSSDLELDLIASQLHAQYNSSVLENSSRIGIRGAQLIRLPEHVTVAEAAAWYERNSSVLFAEPDYIAGPPPLPASGELMTGSAESPEERTVTRMMALLYPDDPYYSSQWNLQKMGLPSAWEITTGSDSVVIAVLDTGIDDTNPDFSGNIWTNTGEIPDNGIDDDGNGYIDDVHGWDFIQEDNSPGDNVGHGTEVASIIASRGNNGIGVAGIMWNARIMPVKVGDVSGFYGSNVVRGIEYAKNNGADIIVCSFGGYEYSNLQQAAFDQAPDPLFVCAAGNEGLDTDVFLHYPSCFPNPNVISVAATDPDDDLCYFSNYGQNSVDVGAPGSDIPALSLNSRYYYADGTSVATPHVAGLAGLILSIDPTIPATGLRELIMNNVDLTGLNGYVGSAGRINAYRTVSAVEYPPGYTITATAGPGGTISPSGNIPVPAGSSRTFYFTPDNGYVISDIVVDGGSSGAFPFYAFQNVQSDHTITALFRLAGTEREEMWVALAPGWNFISTPGSLIEGHDTMRVVFHDIDTAGHSLFSYNAESGSWTNLKGDDTFEPFIGIWVYSSGNTYIVLQFKNGNDTPAVSLYPGWNAIGCPGPSDIAARDAFASITDDWSLAMGFDAVLQRYEVSLINGGSGSHSDSNTLSPAKGYWVYVRNPCVLR